MRISVIIPVYNSERYLEKCLSSVIAQTYHDLEILCIDDGSTDNSSKILQMYAARDPRINVFSQKNSGVSAARNRGLELATGEWISFVDSDDELELDMYEILISLAIEHNADIAHCGYKRMCLDGTTKDVCGTGMLLVQNSAEASKCMLEGTYFSNSLWNKLYRRTLFDDVWFDPSLKINEDVLVNVQVFAKANKLAFIDVPKYHYFEREQSACNTTMELRKKQDCVEAAEKMLSLHRGGELESVCADRLMRTLIDLYRYYVLNNRETKTECDRIHQKICCLGYEGISARNRWNYRFMRCLPTLYRLVYSLYDRIRTPNWDIK